MTGPAPADIGWLRRTASFFPSRTILTANNFRIFDLLEGKGKTAAGVAKAISADRRASELLLNSLAAIGLLKKTGETYRNAPVASRYLVKGKPGYQGNILRHYHTLWENWSELDTVVKTGRPNRKGHDHESFILGMHDLALQKVKKVIGSLDLRGVKTALDLGGGPGTYSMGFARKKISATLFDFPATLKISRRLIREAGLAQGVKLHPGDFTKDPLGGPYDLIFISQVFHSYSPKQCAGMLAKCRSSLGKGGRVVIQEFYLDETKTAPMQGALFAINMLVNTPEGRSYTPQEMISWLKKTGFTDVRQQMLDETVLVTGRKR
ncbi:MAG: methyltransferase [Nitrospiraceae bacterium]|nr:methyltransferase [Nitrospiraceae bacterium]